MGYSLFSLGEMPDIVKSTYRAFFSIIYIIVIKVVIILIITMYVVQDYFMKQQPRHNLLQWRLEQFVALIRTCVLSYTRSMKKSRGSKLSISTSANTK